MGPFPHPKMKLCVKLKKCFIIERIKSWSKYFIFVHSYKRNICQFKVVISLEQPFILLERELLKNIFDI